MARKRKPNKRQRLLRRIEYAAWITLFLAVIGGVYWFSVGQQRFALTSFSDGESAMLAGIYAEANQGYQRALRNSHHPEEMRKTIKQRYLAHLQVFLDNRQYPQAQKAYCFLQALFPGDPEVKKQGLLLQLLLVPVDQLKVSSQKLFAGYQGRFLKDGDLLTEDIRGAHWIFDPVSLATRRVFEVSGKEKLLSIAPSGTLAAVCQEGSLGILTARGSMTKTMMAVTPDSVCSWSPDERQVVVESSAGQLGMLDITSGETKTLSRGSWPSWSPNGESLAFMASTSLVVEPPQGGAQKTLLKLKRDLLVPPLWSPRGDRLVAIGDRLRVLDLAGRTLLSLEGDQWLPAWAPSGDKLLVAKLGTPELKVFDLKKRSKDLQFELPVSSCEWSPSGAQILVNCQSRDGQEQAMSLLQLGQVF